MTIASESKQLRLTGGVAEDQAQMPGLRAPVRHYHPHPGQSCKISFLPVLQVQMGDKKLAGGTVGARVSSPITMDSKDNRIHK